MKNIYRILLDEYGRGEGLCLATLVDARGSVPQVPGSLALFSAKGLLAGTLGGGVLEGDASARAADVIGSGKPVYYEYGLNADIEDKEGAICGGSAWVLLDPVNDENLDIFRKLNGSVEKGIPGLLLTEITKGKVRKVSRSWHENPREISPSEEYEGLGDKIRACLEKSVCGSLELPGRGTVFIEPVQPLPKLIIAGAGHIGRALAHQGNLLDFEVTVIDDREEYANSTNIPDADHILVKPVGAAISEIPKTPDTYIVIVTRGHRDDTEALRACIKHDLPYIGMIGSRKKIRLLKQKFIAGDWSTEEEFRRIHAPVGIEIGSVSVQEIALSIAAQLVQVRASGRRGKRREYISSIVLAAGESSRMGKPKMLLPYGGSSIIETVVANAGWSMLDLTFVVLGADPEATAARLKDSPVRTVVNGNYRDGMLTSVQAGLQALPEKTTAVMVLLGDQPMISHGIMDRLIDHYKRSDRGIAVACSKGKRGHPLIFSAGYIPEILSYGKENSLRDLLDKHAGDITELETGSAEILRDIDTEDDYKKELKHL